MNYWCDAAYAQGIIDGFPPLGGAADNLSARREGKRECNLLEINLQALCR